ncbi:MAG: hypothetical protein KC496_13555, partial [Anaerolineae bacterium]|nr:hypothetical protein [Anaerolineae bacterium]
MGRGTNQVYNIISVFFLALSVVAMVIFGVMLLRPAPASEEVVAVLPTRYVPPTATATFTPSITPTASRTPLPTWTPTEPATDTPFPTLIPSDTATATLGATATATITFTPSPTNTPAETDTATPTATATGPTPTVPPPLPFGLLSDPAFTQNNFNTAGCSWQGIGGQILGVNQQPYTGPQLIVHVYSAQQDFPRVNTGTNSAYGASGFEIAVAQSLVPGVTYFVDLET